MRTYHIILKNGVHINIYCEDLIMTDLPKSMKIVNPASYSPMIEYIDWNNISAITSEPER